jgi:hypothetical protein
MLRKSKKGANKDGCGEASMDGMSERLRSTLREGGRESRRKGKKRME